MAPPRVTADDAVIVISHRGTKRSSYDALDVANDLGAYTVAITSTDPGPRILAADAGIRTVAQEKSAAFTISYATALTALAMLNLGMAGRLDDPGNGLDAFPGQIAGILAKEEDVRAVVAEHHPPAPVHLGRLGRQPRQCLRGRPQDQGNQPRRLRGLPNPSSCFMGPSAPWIPIVC